MITLFAGMEIRMRMFERYGLWTAFAVTTLAISILIGGSGGFDEISVRAVIRFTARTSLVFFLMAFIASAARTLWPSPFTVWLRRNRRYLGLSFAFSHFVHGIAIIAYARMGAEQAAVAVTPDMLIFGGFGYLVIAAMAATSFDRTAAMLGPRLWRALHTFGVYFLWVQFLVAFGKRAPAMPGYAIFIALLVVAMAVRIVAMRRKSARVDAVT
jgi:sulfoxide reductase heme-binding subunit YedZ